MPTIINIEGFRFFFYSNEHDPLHIHVEKGNSTAKYNLIPIELVFNYGFHGKELKKIREIIEIYSDEIINKWNEYFSN